MGSMAVILLVDVILVLAVGLPIFLACRRWAEWVDRLSDRLQPFERPRRFGRRSWAARSFVLKTPADEVVRSVDTLTEAEWTASEDNPFSALAPMLGSEKVPTGIEIEWLDGETASLHARQYADWPHTPEDERRLPFKQRQRLAENVLLYIEPLADENARVSYELQFPAWIYVIYAAVLLFMLWATWCVAECQDSAPCARLAGRYGLELGWLLWNMAVPWILVVWAVVNAVRLLRLQNISLLDNVISTFGSMASRDE